MAEVFPKDLLQGATWPPEMKDYPGGHWVPYGPWRFNREAGVWQRTYDYIVGKGPKKEITRLVATTQRIKVINPRT